MSYNMQILGPSGWQTVIPLDPGGVYTEKEVVSYLLANTASTQFNNRHAAASWRVVDGDTDDEEIFVARGGYDNDPSYLHSAVNLFIQASSLPMNTIVLAPDFYT